MTAKEAYDLVLKKSQGKAEIGICMDLGWLGYVFSYSKDPEEPDPFVRVDKKTGKMYPFVPIDYGDEIEEAIKKGKVTENIDDLD